MAPCRACLATIRVLVLWLGASGFEEVGTLDGYIKSFGCLGAWAEQSQPQAASTVFPFLSTRCFLQVTVFALLWPFLSHPTVVRHHRFVELPPASTVSVVLHTNTPCHTSTSHLSTKQLHNGPRWLQLRLFFHPSTLSPITHHLHHPYATRRSKEPQIPPQ